MRQLSPDGAIYSMYSQAGQPLWVRDERLGKRRQTIYLQGTLIAERLRPIGTDDETIKYQHADLLGTPVVVTNTSASPGVDNTFEYEPYGRLLFDTHDDTVGYTGHVMDKATGLLYMQQRYYDPAVGRFLSVDPVSASSINGGNFNRYWYANNNPYKFVDPDGRYACEGGKSACAAVAKQVANIGKAAEALPQGSEGNQALSAISSFYGKPGEKNGVVVQAEANLGGTADGRSRIDNGTVTIRVDSQGISERSGAAAPEVLANTLVHEGSHGVDQKAAGGMTYSRSELEQGEMRAYQAQGFYAKGSGRDVFGMLKPDGSVDGAQVKDLARQSVELACQTGACRD